MTPPMQDAQAVVNRIIAAPTPTVSAQDAAILLACPQRTLMMEKLLAVHFNVLGDFEKALTHATLVFDNEKTSENAKNTALMYRKSKKIEQGIAFCRENEAVMDPLSFHDVMAMLHWDAKDNAAAARHGDASLALKDQTCKAAPKLTPKINQFDPNKPKQNVIVFSLWGKDPRYLAGAQNNAVVARYLYPGWQCRFYVILLTH